MKHLSRRDFLHAGCTIVGATLAPHFIDQAKARILRGSASVITNNNRVTINPPISYLNLAKGFGFPAQDPTTVSSDGYPTSTPSANIIANPSMPANYYGTFTWSWGGTGAMIMNGGPPMVIASGGAAIFELSGAASGELGPGNHTLSGPSNTQVTAPSVVFAFGWNIQSISSGAGGVITINTITNHVNSGSGYTISGSTVNITGANSNTGANGTWTITNLTASSFDLVGSTFTNAQAGVAGQAVFAASNLSVAIRNSGMFTGFSNLVWCRTGDAAQIASGQLIDNTVISQLQYLCNGGSSLASRGWLRFMDNVAVQSSFECDFSQRISATNINFPATSLRSGYWIGAITNGGSDNYTCSDPFVSTWNGSSYIDNAIVQGTPSATNSGGTPSLAVGGHPAKPVYDWNNNVAPFILKLTGAPPTPGTDVLQYTFQATWLNSNTPYVFSYPTKVTDTTISILNASLATALSADATLTSNLIFIANPQNGVGPFIFPRTPQAGRLTITYSSGPAISQVWNMKTSIITAGSSGTFIYNYLLDGWIYRAGGMSTSVPLEVIVEMCNRVGAHCWINWGTTRAAWITAVTQFFGDPTTGLMSGLRFGNETYNEVWNSSAFPFSTLQALGNALGWSSNSFVSNFSYTALRTIQYQALAQTAWTGKGRNASDLYIFQMAQTTDVSVNGNFATSQLKGTSLNASTNTIYGTYGGLNGSGSSPSYTANGSRPVDITTAIGIAPYWGSPWLSKTNTSIVGPITQNVPWLQASLDFVNGNTATAFTSMVNQFNGTTTRAVGGPVAQVLANTNATTNWYDFVFTTQEAQAAQFDSFRAGQGMAPLAIIHYEGASQWAVGSDPVGGTNSVTDTGPLITQITALQSSQGPWDVSPYTVSGTNNVTELATQELKLIQGWKNDTDVNGNPARLASYKNFIKTSYYQQLVSTSGANRETKPAQYGYQANIWGLFPTSLFNANPYQNYDTIHEFNAGG